MACELRRFRTARHRYQRSGPPTKGQGAPHQRCNGDAPRLAATKPPAPSICSPQSGSECDRRYSRAARRTPVDAATGARRSEQGRQRGLHLCRSGRVSVRLRRPNEPSRYDHPTADEEDRDRPRVDRAVLPFVELVGGDRPAPADPRFRVSWRPRVGATAVVYWGTGLQQLAVPGDRRPTAGRSASRGPPLGFARGTELIGSRATANLLTGLGIDAYLTRTDDAGRRGFLTDALGSTIALTADTRAVLTEYTYDPFGATSASGEASANPFQYTGREHDGATGLYYYRTRYYSPELHRFIAEDRLEIEPWETNLYAYVGNDPVGFVDPYGQHSVAIAAGAAALGAAGFVFLYQGGVEALGNPLMALLQMIFDAMNAARAAMNAQGSGSGDAGDAPAVGPSPAADAAGKDGVAATA